MIYFFCDECVAPLEVEHTTTGGGLAAVNVKPCENCIEGEVEKRLEVGYDQS